MVKIDKKITYYDKSTGEIFHEKDMITGTYFDEEKGYLFWNRKAYAKMFSCVDFPPNVTDAEIGKLTKLAKKIYSNTNMLAYRGNGGVTAHNIETISNVLSITDRQCSIFINKMIRLGIMGKAKYEVEGKICFQYYLNPIYFFSSNRIPLNLYLIFKDQLDAILPKWVKDKYADIRDKEGIANGC